MNPVATGILQQPFVQVALPIVVALTLAAWLHQRLEQIESVRDGHANYDAARMTALPLAATDPARTDTANRWQPETATHPTPQWPY